MRSKFTKLLALVAALFTGLSLAAEMPEGINRTSPPATGGEQGAIVERATRRRTLQDARAAAAVRTKAALKAKGFKVDPKSLGTNPSTTPVPKVVGALPGAANGPQAGLAVGPQVLSPGFKLQQPDYMFGTASNWHNTKPLRKFLDPLPGIISTTDPTSAGLKHGIPVAIPNRSKYADSDYYEIDVVDYIQQLHSELNPTRLRGYQNHNAASEGQVKTAAVNYLGPIIIAKKDRPVRVKMFNYLPTGPVDSTTGRRPGDLFIPVDKTLSGAGLGPLSYTTDPVTKLPVFNGVTETFTENREEFHLHGGLSPWISDGTPHQWITPAKETTLYPKGYVFQNVPDMSADYENGAATYFWSNQQSGRLMFYHDHAFGLTRLNVYAGTAAGYLIVDPTETRLINAGIIPSPGSKLPISDDPWDMKPFNATTHPVNPPLVDEVAGLQNVYTYGIPLVIQDKTFVDTSTMNMEAGKGVVGVYQIATNPAQPDPYLPDHLLPITTGRITDLAGNVTNWQLKLDAAGNPIPATDPTWDINAYGSDGSLWYPHVYMPNQNPADLSGANAMGRWDYGAWFWPPLVPTSAGGTLVHGEVPIPLDPNGTTIPGTPNPSLTPEAFMDTPVVNGMAYPTLTVNPIAYRFRILSAGNDRVLNLSWFKADATGLEVPMVPAAPNSGWPAYWPTDGRDGGVPDPLAAGPSWIQIGNEAGFIPNPTVIPPTPIGYNYNRRDIVVLNIISHGLLLGPAERADVIVDFSAFAGQTLILYNDSPAPVPAFDARLDYYAGDPDQQSSGGAPTTMPGYGPNTRTVMQVKVAAGTPGAPYDVAALNAAWASTPTSKGAFEEAQHLPIVPQIAYNTALNRNVTKDTWARIQDYSFFPNAANPGFIATENGAQVNPTFHNAAIQELWELDYGRMNATLGVEIPKTTNNIQTTIPLGYVDPTTESLQDGTSGFWKITHNGVDTHPVHFHLFEVQVVNRVGWDGAVRFPDPNELGWKETLRMNPLEDVVVAFRPLSPRMPASMTGANALPNSLRPPDVLVPTTAMITVADLTNFPATNPNIGNPVSILNTERSYGWEYVWHCHILGHEENDFMRPLVLNVATTVPAAPSLLPATAGNPQPSGILASPARVDLAWVDNSNDETGFLVQRSPYDPTFVVPYTWTDIGTTVPNQNNYSDFTLTPGASLAYRFIAYNQAGKSAASDPVYINAQAPVSISGQVTELTPATSIPPSVSSNLAGVTISFTNGGGPGVTTTTTTLADGTYTAPVPYLWTGTITPSFSTFAFIPAAITISTAAVANLTAQNFVRPVATLSGTVTDKATGTAIANVAVTLSNNGGSTATDVNGRYSVRLNSGWAGTVTVAKANWAFITSPATVPAVTVDTTLNFMGVPAATITGTVSYLNSLGATGGLSGVTITPSPASTTAVSPAITGSTGAYTLNFAGLPWTGALTAAFVGAGASYDIVPAPLNTSLATTGLVNPGDSLVQNFTATQVVTISGTVNGASKAPILITFVGAIPAVTGGAITTTTDALGNYSLKVRAPFTGTVTPSYTGLVFSPASIPFTNLVVNQTGVNFQAQVQITGVVSYTGQPAGTLPLAGVTITAAGSAAGSTTTAANGTYLLTLNAPWTGTLTPTLSGYIFNPVVASLSLTLSGTQNFTYAPGIEVSGQIYDNTIPITPLVGVVVSFTNGGGPGITTTVTTDASGFYIGFVPRGWSGSVTPSATNPVTGLPYAFNPMSRNFNNVTTTQTRGNFVVSSFVVLSGTVFSGTTPLPGVTITLNNGGGTTTTNASGFYSITLASGWTGTVTPTARGRIFNPTSILQQLTADTTLNFYTYQSITGQARIRVNGTNYGVPGVTITATGSGTSATVTATTNATGNYTLLVLTGWTGTITAGPGTNPVTLATITTWTPANFTYTTPVTANITGLRFTGQ